MSTATITHHMVPLVETTRGAVRGTWENGVAVFRGIPYAESPVGKLRFKPPAARKPWEGVRDATRFGEIVPQTDESPIDKMSLPTGVPQGDDCLNLNVWTPELGRASLPVLVWLHGVASDTAPAPVPCMMAPRSPVTASSPLRSTTD